MTVICEAKEAWRPPRHMIVPSFSHGSRLTSPDLQALGALRERFQGPGVD
jgi:hypothetical protein